jgi:hypothetical protein
MVADMQPLFFELRDQLITFLIFVIFHFPITLTAIVDGLPPGLQDSYARDFRLQMKPFVLDDWW